MSEPGFLRITTPDGQVKEYAVDFTSAIVGRADGNRIVIPHVSISRRHAHLTVENGQLFVEDFSSATGTFVGDVQLQPDERRLVPPGADLRFGDARATYVIPQAAPAPAPTPVVAPPPPRPVDIEPPPPPRPVETIYTAPPVNDGPPTPAPVPHTTAIPHHLAQAMDVTPSAAMAAQSEASKRQYIGVTLASPTGPVAPGVASAATVTLQNRGSVVDEFSVTVEGIPPEWVEIARPRISLLPGSKDDLTVVIRPGAGPAATAGQHPFTVVVHSREHGIDVRSVGQFTITPIERLEASLRPIRGAGPFTLTVTNSGNVVAPLSVEGSDDEDKLLFTVPPDTVVQPGETLTLPVRVQARRGVKVDKESATAFRLLVRSAQSSAAPIRLDGTALLQPASRRWKAPVAALVVLGVLGAGAFGVVSACSSDTGVCSDIRGAFAGDDNADDDRDEPTAQPTDTTRQQPTTAATVVVNRTTVPTMPPTHTPTTPPTHSPPSPTPTTPVNYDVTGRWELADTVTFGRDTGQTYRFVVEFDELDEEGLTIVGVGIGVGLKFDGYRQGNFVKLDFTRDSGEPGGVFEWEIQPDGRLVGTYEDYRTENGGNSIGIRQR